MKTVAKRATPVEPFREIVQPATMDRLEDAARRVALLLAGRTVWHVNSTAEGGGVAEMLHSLLGYYRACGLDAKWVVLAATTDFFRVTKRIHNRLHDTPGDGGQLDQRERMIYERGLSASKDALLPRVASGDVVILHDPETFGLAPALSACGAIVICVCHVGVDLAGLLARSTWEFFARDTDAARAVVFSRSAYVWSTIEPARSQIIPPCIDPFSANNSDLDAVTCRAILSASSLVPAGIDGPIHVDTPRATELWVRRPARVVEDVCLTPVTPLVVQVSRWDRLKDPEGVLQGFLAGVPEASGAHLVLAGPAEGSVSDDPEGHATFTSVLERWERLPAAERSRVHIASLPMEDLAENAAIVNALQRRADVVVQKSPAEGFGLTVTEAMWKERIVVASRVGGIQDQIDDGIDCVLVDPLDLDGFGAEVEGILNGVPHEEMGRRAKDRVRSAYLPPHHLTAYLELIGEVAGV